MHRRARRPGKSEDASPISRSRRVLSILREIDQHLDALEHLKGISDLPKDAGDRRIKALDEKVRAEEALTRLSTDEALIKEHAEKAGFPADSVSEIKTIIDPTTSE